MSSEFESTQTGLTDLSHWDFVDEFTMWQAACLVVGVDPYKQRTGPSLEAALVHKKMTESYTSAVSNMRYLTSGVEDAPSYSVYDKYLCSSEMNSLSWKAHQYLT